MSARGGWIWMAAALLAAVFAFAQKQEAKDLRAHLADLEDELAETRGNVRVLAAEWSFLSRPERLKDLAGRYLDGFAPMSAKQVSSLADIPFRPPALDAGTPWSGHGGETGEEQGL